MKQFEIRSLKQAKQACMNAVLRGLAHQKWVSDGVAWSEKNHGSLEPDEFGPGIAFYSSLGWLVQKGLHKRVFEARNTEVGLLTWSYEGVIHNSHPQLASWHSKYVQSLYEKAWPVPKEPKDSTHTLVGLTYPNRFVNFLNELHTAYVEGRHEPRKLFATMQDMVSTHELKWPEDVLLPPVFPTNRNFSPYMCPSPHTSSPVKYTSRRGSLQE